MVDIDIYSDHFFWFECNHDSQFSSRYWLSSIRIFFFFFFIKFTRACSRNNCTSAYLVEFGPTRSPGPSTPRFLQLSSSWSDGPVRRYSRSLECRVLRPDQGQVNGQGHSEGPPQDHSYLDQSLSSRNVPRCQPIAAILLREPTPSKNVGHRGNINAPVSPFFPFLSFPFVRSLPTDHFFFLFLSFIRSRTLAHARLTYLARG